jgi:hypothetical protein
LLPNQHLWSICSSLNKAGYRKLLQGRWALVGPAGDRCDSAANRGDKSTIIDELHIAAKSTFVVVLFVPEGTPTSEVGICRTGFSREESTIVDELNIAAKSTFVVDLFVPKGTPTRGGRWHL